MEWTPGFIAFLAGYLVVGVVFTVFVFFATAMSIKDILDGDRSLSNVALAIVGSMYLLWLIL